MYVKDSNLYFDKNDYIAFKNVKFALDFDINSEIPDNDKVIVFYLNRKRIKNSSEDKRVSLKYNELRIDFKHMTNDRNYIRMPCVADKKLYKMQLLSTIRKSLKIICNVLLKLNEFVNKKIIPRKSLVNIGLSYHYNIYVCIKNDGGPNLVMNTECKFFYIYINNTDFNNVDSIQYDDMIYSFIFNTNRSSDEIVIKNNILQSGTITMIFPKSNMINGELKAQTSRIIDVHINNGDILTSSIFDTIYLRDHAPSFGTHLIKRWRYYYCINYRIPFPLLIKFIENIKCFEHINNLEINNEYDILKYL